MPDAFAPRPSQAPTAPLFSGAALELRDQLDRASISIVLNIAEGCGRRSPADKARFYSMARGSATECAAILDLLGVRELVDDRPRKHARALLVRTVQMLTRLVTRMAASNISRP